MMISSVEMGKDRRKSGFGDSLKQRASIFDMLSL